MIPESQKAYIAGFVDGEGCTGVFKCGGYYKMYVQISNTDIRPLEFIRERYGGSIAERKTKVRSNHKSQYKYTLCKEAAHRLLRDIVPYLIIKKDVANVAMSFSDIRWGDTDSKRGLYLQTRELNRRGVSVSEGVMV